MQKPLTMLEKYLLAEEVPALALPGLENPTEIDLWERAAVVGYPDEAVPRGEGNLVEYMKILGVLPSTFEERLAAVGG